VSLALHFLYSHLDFFLEKMRAIFNEHGETVHHDISQIEKRYSGKWNPVCFLTTAGILYGRCQLTDVRGERR
jgi:cyclopropane fatty-acyl-phospholipid synthase-like methyltransferase